MDFFTVVDRNLNVQTGDILKFSLLKLNNVKMKSFQVCRFESTKSKWKYISKWKISVARHCLSLCMYSCISSLCVFVHVKLCLTQWSSAVLYSTSANHQGIILLWCFRPIKVISSNHCKKSCKYTVIYLSYLYCKITVLSTVFPVNLQSFSVIRLYFTFEKSVKKTLKFSTINCF